MPCSQFEEAIATSLDPRQRPHRAMSMHENPFESVRKDTSAKPEQGDDEDNVSTVSSLSGDSKRIQRMDWNSEGHQHEMTTTPSQGPPIDIWIATKKCKKAEEEEEGRLQHEEVPLWLQQPPPPPPPFHPLSPLVTSVPSPALQKPTPPLGRRKPSDLSKPILFPVSSSCASGQYPATPVSSSSLQEKIGKQRPKHCRLPTETSLTSLLEDTELWLTNEFSSQQHDIMRSSRRPGPDVDMIEALASPRSSQLQQRAVSPFEMQQQQPHHRRLPSDSSLLLGSRPRRKHARQGSLSMISIGSIVGQSSWTTRPTTEGGTSDCGGTTTMPYSSSSMSARSLYSTPAEEFRSVCKANHRLNELCASSPTHAKPFWGSVSGNVKAAVASASPRQVLPKKKEKVDLVRSKGLLT